MGHANHSGGTVPTLEVPSRTSGLQGLLGVHPFIIFFTACLFLYPAVANDYWTFNVTTGLILAIACLGLLVVVGWGRDISLAQAGLTGASLYLTGYAARGHIKGEKGMGLAFPLAACVGMAFVVGASVLVALISMRLSGVYVIVLTLSLQFLLENSLFTQEALTGGLAAPSTPRPKFFGISMESDKRFYYYILTVLLVLMVLLTRFRHSRFGRSLLMVGSDKAAAAAVGVSPWMYKVAAFAIAGSFAGVAGALSAPLYRNPPGTIQYISFNSLFYLAVPILAGFESMMATVGCSIFFQVLPQVLLAQKINVYLLGGLGLTVGILAGPRGAGGAMIDLFDQRGRARRREAKIQTVARPTANRPAGSRDPVAARAARNAQLGGAAKRPVSAGSEKK